MLAGGRERGGGGEGTYQVQDDLAVRVGLEFGLALQLLAQDPVVVDFAVDGQKEGFFLID